MAIVSSGQLTLTDLNDSKQLILYLNPNYKTQIYDPNTSTYTPNFTSSNLVITPELYIAGGSGTNILPTTQVTSLTWYEGTQTTTALATGTGTTTAGYSYSIPTGTVGTTALPLTIKSNITASNSQIYTCVIAYTDPATSFSITVKAQYEVVKITNGQTGTAGVNAITAFLTNDSVTLAADNSGNVTVFANSGTDIHVYEGATEVQYDGVGTANSTYKVTLTPSTGLTAGAVSDSGAYATVANATAFSSANDTATLTIAITGKTSLGTAINITKIQSFSKSKMGGTPTSYWMSVNSNVIQKNVAGAVSPASITITGYSQLGTAAPTSTAIFKFVTDTTTDGTTWTDNHASPTAAVASTTYTTSGSVKGVRFRMYQSSVTPSTTNMIDEQTVWVVSDGATGIDSYYLNVWAPNGDTIRNSGGNVVLEADMYKGAGTITPTAFKWYLQDPLATTGSGGDADGGNGWRLVQGISAPTTAPTQSGVSNASTQMTAGNFYSKYTYCGYSGETVGSSESSVYALAANNDLKVTVPVVIPAGVQTTKVYVGTATGQEYYAGDLPSNGAVEKDTLTITAAATTAGNVTITLNGTAVNIAVAASDTTSAVATKVAAGAYTGFTASASGAVVTFTATTIGTKTAPSYSAGSTGATGSIVVTTAGTYNSLTVTKFDNTAEAIPTSDSASTTNVTSAQITIRNWAIDGVQGFKCVATAPTTGSKYSGVAICKDFQDPIAVSIIGSNIFKNGQGSLTLQAQLLQAGAQIASTGYSFTWALYDNSGNLIKTYSGVNGDTITVPSSDVTGTANLVVDVNK